MKSEYLDALSQPASRKPGGPAPSQGHIPFDNTEIYYREIGNGKTIILLHGGPDFDHTYLLPEMDRLSDSFRLIYYDQRGRGKSARNVQPDDVTMQTDIEDLERLREYFQLETFPVLGHSWGCLLAMEYALRHPQRASHLLLVNTAPASHNDYLLLREDRRKRAAADVEALKARSADARYQAGDPDTVAAYYRIHFRAALRQPEHLESVIARLRSSFTQDGILKAREIEKRLMRETWLSNEYNLLPMLERLDTPTLVLYGDHDFIPAECSVHVAQAIPGARLDILSDCGHFSYLERPHEFHKQITEFVNEV